MKYSLVRPVGSRVLSVEVNGIPLQLEQTYDVATVEIMAQGGDLFHAFRDAHRIERKEVRFADLLTSALREAKVISLPTRGRLIAVD